MDENSALATVQAPGGSIYTSESSFMLAQRMAQSLAASSIVPPSYQGQQGLANCLVALEVATRLGTSPLMIMQNMQPVHGRPVWSSSFMIGLVNSCGRYSPLRFAYDNPDEPTACYAYATDLRSGEMLRGTTITMAMAKAEGWLTRKGSKWQTMPGQMLMYRAASFWARAYASDLTLGIRPQDEVVDIEEVRVATVTETAPPKLSQPGQRAMAAAAAVKSVAEAQRAVEWLDSSGLPPGEVEQITAAIDQRVGFLTQPAPPEAIQAAAAAMNADPRVEAAFRQMFQVPADVRTGAAITQQQHTLAFTE